MLPLRPCCEQRAGSHCRNPSARRPLDAAVLDGRRLAVGTLAREVAALAPRRLACRLATEGPELGGSSAGAGGCVFGAEESTGRGQGLAGGDRG